ncbi:hypothetical protein V4C53_39055 [Paraburkholderia azotifigens]|uniref:hypothetical protein n=1 Tax=Paraburkholderia azotifigens TaxID=2057004 RepID=UPI0004B0479F
MNDTEHTYSPRRCRSATTEYAAGSIAWYVQHLDRGESWLTEDVSESMHRACHRAIEKVTQRQPMREYVLSTYYAVHSKGDGQTFALLKLKRLE